MLFQDAAKSGDFTTAQASARGHFHWIQPEFRYLFLGGHMDVRRFSGRAFVAVEEKPGWVLSQQCRQPPQRG